jgi:hypothetical protein
MKKIVVISFIILSSSFFTICSAQYVRPEDNTTPPPSGTAPAPPPPSALDKFSIGGGFGLQFGTITFIELEPLLNYHINQSLMVGIGPIYQYESWEGSAYYGYAGTSSLYGARVSAIFFLPDEFSRVFIMGEYDIINVTEPRPYNYTVERGNIALPMAGIGYKEPVSDRAFFYIYGLWNFNNTIYNPYTNPIINVGFDIGLWH